MPEATVIFSYCAILFWVAWLIKLNTLRNYIKRRKVLSSNSFDGPPPDPPRVSLLIAAKDEEDNIDACIASALALDYPNLEIIAIDDRSTDRTPEILARHAQEHKDRLRVITIKQLREGWFGKNNAMHEGAMQSTGEWICMFDADCRQISTRTMTVAVQDALEHEVDFLTITPVLETRTVWEKILMPVCTGILIMWFRPSRCNNPRSRTAYANGAFMMIRRSCYDAIGGHKAVRTEVNEDMLLARRAKQQGFRLRVVENDDLFVSRMYRSFSEIWRGWSRIYYGSFQSVFLLVAAALISTLLPLTPWACTVAALFGWLIAGQNDGWGSALILWLGAAVTMQLYVAWFYNLLQADRKWSITYALGVCCSLGMLISAMLKTVGATRTTWRGTSYLGSQVVADPTNPTAGNPTVDEQPIQN